MKNLLSIFFLFPFTSFCQLTHTVTPKETWYSVARQYNVPPKEIAAYNNLTIETGLTIGQVLKIPSMRNPDAVNRMPAGTVPPKKIIASVSPEKSTAIYHKVEKKETLYHISKQFNTTVENIKQWNNLSVDGVSEGTNLIVGYKPADKTQPVVDAKPVIEKDVPAVEAPKRSSVATSADNSPKATASENNIPPVTTTNSAPVKPVAKSATGKNFSGGFFKKLYDDQAANKKNIVEESGTAAIFKSTSGWEDGKYYCLHNSAPSGSFIKITNKATQKFVFAKVLDVIPDLKQNSGIVLRLSNAAADELGAGDANFEAMLNY